MKELSLRVMGRTQRREWREGVVCGWGLPRRQNMGLLSPEYNFTPSEEKDTRRASSIELRKATEIRVDGEKHVHETAPHPCSGRARSPS